MDVYRRTYRVLGMDARVRVKVKVKVRVIIRIIVPIGLMRMVRHTDIKH